MSDEVKKTITVGELVARKYGKDISSLNLPSIDLSAIQKVAETVHASFERIREPLARLQEAQHTSIIPYIPDSEVIWENYRSPESYILEEQRNMVDELRTLNEYLAPRNKKKSVIFFDEDNKTFIRDTDSVSYRCKFSEKGMNFKLIMALLDHDGFRQTRHLQKDIGSKTDEAVRKKVQKINEEFAKKLKKADLKLVVGESGAGYRINPELKIQFL